MTAEKKSIEGLTDYVEELVEQQMEELMRGKIVEVCFDTLCTWNDDRSGENKNIDDFLKAVGAKSERDKKVIGQVVSYMFARLVESGHIKFIHPYSVMTDGEPDTEFYHLKFDGDMESDHLRFNAVDYDEKTEVGQNIPLSVEIWNY